MFLYFLIKIFLFETQTKFLITSSAEIYLLIFITLNDYVWLSFKYMVYIQSYFSVWVSLKRSTNEK